jgi:hypothetical protein
MYNSWFIIISRKSWPYIGLFNSAIFRNAIANLDLEQPFKATPWQSRVIGKKGQTTSKGISR